MSGLSQPRASSSRLRRKPGLPPRPATSGPASRRSRKRFRRSNRQGNAGGFANSVPMLSGRRRPQSANFAVGSGRELRLEFVHPALVTPMNDLMYDVRRKFVDKSTPSLLDYEKTSRNDRVCSIYREPSTQAEYDTQRSHNYLERRRSGGWGFGRQTGRSNHFMNKFEIGAVGKIKRRKKSLRRRHQTHRRQTTTTTKRPKSTIPGGGRRRGKRTRTTTKTRTGRQILGGGGRRSGEGLRIRGRRKKRGFRGGSDEGFDDDTLTTTTDGTMTTITTETTTTPRGGSGSGRMTPMHMMMMRNSSHSGGAGGRGGVFGRLTRSSVDVVFGDRRQRERRRRRERKRSRRKQKRNMLLLMKRDGGDDRDGGEGAISPNSSMSSSVVGGGGGTAGVGRNRRRGRRGRRGDRQTTQTTTTTRPGTASPTTTTRFSKTERRQRQFEARRRQIKSARRVFRASLPPKTVERLQHPSTLLFDEAKSRVLSIVPGGSSRPLDFSRISGRFGDDERSNSTIITNEEGQRQSQEQEGQASTTPKLLRPSTAPAAAGFRPGGSGGRQQHQQQQQYQRFARVIPEEEAAARSRELAAQSTRSFRLTTSRAEHRSSWHLEPSPGDRVEPTKYSLANREALSTSRRKDVKIPVFDRATGRGDFGKKYLTPCETWDLAYEVKVPREENLAACRFFLGSCRNGTGETVRSIATRTKNIVSMIGADLNRLSDFEKTLAKSEEVLKRREKVILL